MGLRKQIRELELFPNIKEPNLMLYLDLVAVGTICDIVNINNYNRSIVSKGLELIRSRKNKSITKILDNSNICLLYTSPSPRDRTRSRMPSSA